MADNSARTPGSGQLIASDEATYSSDTAHVQLVRVVHVSGSEGAKTVAEIADAHGFFVQGSIAHDAADAGNPFKVGGVARTSLPTSVADGDRVDASYTKHGNALVTLGAPRELVVDQFTILTTTTETTILAAGAAGVFHDLAGLLITNVSTQLVRVDLRDSTGAATPKLSVPCAAAGGGVALWFPVPLKQTTAANNWTAQLNLAVTDVRITAIAIKQS